MSDTAVSDPPVPTFPQNERVCGNCKLWQAHSIDARGWVGPCRIQPQRGLFPPTAPVCDKFVAKGTTVAALPQTSNRPQNRPVKNIAPMIVRKSNPEGPSQSQTVVFQAPNPANQTLVDLDGLNMTREELMQIFRDAAGDPDSAPMAQKWEGGMIQLLPGKSELQGKELPIDTFFHKIVMVRDRLRTLEQKINAHPKLSDAEKVEMQHYITRVYGSLTSFNVLFRDKGDQFTGQKGDE